MSSPRLNKQDPDYINAWLGFPYETHDADGTDAYFADHPGYDLDMDEVTLRSILQIVLTKMEVNEAQPRQRLRRRSRECDALAQDGTLHTWQCLSVRLPRLDVCVAAVRRTVHNLAPGPPKYNTLRARS
jgi:hypothetical protein